MSTADRPTGSTFPVTRLRRFRRTAALRELVQETRLDVADLVYPLFVCPGEGVENQLEGLDAIVQRSVDRLCDEAEESHALGVRAVLLFGIPESKDEEGSGAWDDRRDRAARPARAFASASRSWFS